MCARLILVLLVLVQGSLFCQTRFSKLYHSPPRSTTLGIYNFERDHFYVTRYNRLAHDITIERRKKSDGSVAAFTPLKLDSVNASWFNYENLDHVFFEKKGILYFVFARVLNNKSELYMKSIDTLGKSSGFIPVLDLGAEKNENYLELTFRLTEEKELLVCRTRGHGTRLYRQIDLYDPVTRLMKHSTKIPPENPETGYSDHYLFSENGDLYYLMYRYNYEWRFTGDGPPDLNYATLTGGTYTVQALELAVLDADRRGFRKYAVELKGVSAVHVAAPLFVGGTYRLQLMYSGLDLEGKEQIRFSVHDYNDGMKRISILDRPLEEKLTHSLTFYDGSDYDEASRKNYSLECRVNAEKSCYHFSERVQQNYFKELLVWQTDTAGRLGAQVVIPRKILYFSDRTRFKNLGKVMHASNGGTVFTFLLENRGNEKVPVDEFKFHDFRRQESVSGANLVVYKLEGGECTKKVVYRNAEYSCVPVNYSGNQPDLVLYLVKNDVERFGIVDLKQL